MTWLEHAEFPTQIRAVKYLLTLSNVYSHYPMVNLRTQHTAVHTNRIDTTLLAHSYTIFTDWPMNNWHNSDQPHTQTSQLGGHQHSHGTPSQKTLLNVLVITSARYSEHTWYAMTSHPTDLARDSLPPTHVSAAAFWCVWILVFLSVPES